MKKETLINVIAVLFVIGGLVWVIRYHGSYSHMQMPSPQSQDGITITQVPIEEENYSGSEPRIEGSSMLAQSAQEYVTTTVGEFAAQADQDVPQMRAQFGSDSPTANYTIDIEAQYLPGPKYNSIVLSQYQYTGGANGMSTYKVFTADNTTGAVVQLADILIPDQQAKFLAYVKKVLLAYKGEGMDSGDPVTFPEDVNALTMDTIQDWSMDNETLTLYFDKYAVAPGAVGAITLPLPLSDIQKYLK